MVRQGCTMHESMGPQTRGMHHQGLCTAPACLPLRMLQPAMRARPNKRLVPGCARPRREASEAEQQLQQLQQEKRALIVKLKQAEAQVARLQEEVEASLRGGGRNHGLPFDNIERHGAAICPCVGAHA